MEHTALDILSAYIAVLFIGKNQRQFQAGKKGNLIRSGGWPPEQGRIWHTESGKPTDSSSQEPLPDNLTI